MTINLLLVGNGNFGKNYVSTLSKFNNINLTVANRNNWKQLIDNGTFDGVMVCTPPQSHIEIASYSLEHGLATMIEKPLALSLSEAETLTKYTSPILVNHIHLFSQNYQDIKKEIGSSPIKKIWSSCVGNNQPRDYSDLWDYGPHDVAMILDIAQQYPSIIKCEKIEERCFSIKMYFSSFSTNTIIGYDLEKDRYLQISLHDKDKLIEYDPYVFGDYPLTNALNVFVSAIHGESDYRLGLDLSLNVTKVLQKCQDLLHFEASNIR